MMSGSGAAPKKPQNRYYPRIKSEILFAYRPAESPPEEARVVKTLSFGLGGIMFEGEDCLPVGSSYRLDLVFGDDRLEVEAKVVYSDPVGGNICRTGFSFTGMSEETRELLTGIFLQEYEKRPPEVP